MKYKKLTLGQVEALINKIGGLEEVRGFLAGDFIFVKQKVEKNPKTFSKEKHLRFLSSMFWREDPIGKGILFENIKMREFFCSLVDEKFEEIFEASFKENKERKYVSETSCYQTITTIGDTTPTRIIQEIFFIMKNNPQVNETETYLWHFLHQDIKYRITFRRLEEKGSLRLTYLMDCTPEKK